MGHDRGPHVGKNSSQCGVQRAWLRICQRRPAIGIYGSRWEAVYLGWNLNVWTVLTMRHGRRRGISWCFSHSDATPVCSDWSDNVWMCQLLPDYVCRLAVGETCWLQYLLLWLCQSWAWTTSCTNSRHLYTHIYRQSSSTSHSGSVLVTTATDIICLASGRLFSHSLQWCGSFHFSFSSFSAGSTSIQLRDPRPGWDVKTASRYLRLKHSL